MTLLKVLWNLLSTYNSSIDLEIQVYDELKKQPYFDYFALSAEWKRSASLASSTGIHKLKNVIWVLEQDEITETLAKVAADAMVKGQIDEDYVLSQLKTKENFKYLWSLWLRLREDCTVGQALGRAILRAKPTIKPLRFEETVRHKKPIKCTPLDWAVQEAEETCQNEGIRVTAMNYKALGEGPVLESTKVTNEKTLHALLNHRLAVRATFAKQWAITVAGVMESHVKTSKQSLLSPSFPTRDAAETAQSEIGIRSLKKLFENR